MKSERPRHRLSRLSRHGDAAGGVTTTTAAKAQTTTPKRWISQRERDAELIGRSVNSDSNVSPHSVSHEPLEPVAVAPRRTVPVVTATPVNNREPKDMSSSPLNVPANAVKMSHRNTEKRITGGSGPSAVQLALANAELTAELVVERDENARLTRLLAKQEQGTEDLRQEFETKIADQQQRINDREATNGQDDVVKWQQKQLTNALRKAEEQLRASDDSLAELRDERVSLLQQVNDLKGVIHDSTRTQETTRAQMEALQAELNSALESRLALQSQVEDFERVALEQTIPNANDTNVTRDGASGQNRGFDAVTLEQTIGSSDQGDCRDRVEIAEQRIHELESELVVERGRVDAMQSRERELADLVVEASERTHRYEQRVRDMEDMKLQSPQTTVDTIDHGRIEELEREVERERQRRYESELRAEERASQLEVTLGDTAAQRDQAVDEFETSAQGLALALQEARQQKARCDALQEELQRSKVARSSALDSADLAAWNECERLLGAERETSISLQATVTKLREQLKSVDATVKDATTHSDVHKDNESQQLATNAAQSKLHLALQAVQTAQDERDAMALAMAGQLHKIRELENRLERDRTIDVVTAPQRSPPAALPLSSPPRPSSGNSTTSSSSQPNDSILSDSGSADKYIALLEHKLLAMLAKPRPSGLSGEVSKGLLLRAARRHEMLCQHLGPTTLAKMESEAQTCGTETTALRRSDLMGPLGAAYASEACGEGPFTALLDAAANEQDPAPLEDGAC